MRLGHSPGAPGLAGGDGLGAEPELGGLSCGVAPSWHRQVEAWWPPRARPSLRSHWVSPRLSLSSVEGASLLSRLRALGSESPAGLSGSLQRPVALCHWATGVEFWPRPAAAPLMLTPGGRPLLRGPRAASSHTGTLWRPSRVGVNQILPRHGWGAPPLPPCGPSPGLCVSTGVTGRLSPSLAFPGG